MVVRIATTAKGVKPNNMDCFPKIGVNPRKKAELRADAMALTRWFI